MWQGQQVGASRKLTITDTGDGMTGEELERHINRLSASGAQQDLAGNFGVGAKISTAPRNPMGVWYRSWKHGVGHEVLLCRDPATGRYGLRQYRVGDDEYTYHPPVPDSYKPALIHDHGTQVILMGSSEEDDTTKPPEGIPASAAWISKYLNSRYFRFPAGVLVYVDERSLDGGSETDRVRFLTGQQPYLDQHAVKSGTVTLTGAKARWWILRDDPSLTADRTYIESAGHTAALYQDELYEPRNGHAGTGRLQQFGIVFGFRRVVIYIEPRSGARRLITSNTTRSHLLLNNEPLPWDTWAFEFRKRMPAELQQFVEEQGAKAADTDHAKTVQRRLSKIIDLFKPQHYRRAAGEVKASDQPGPGPSSKIKADPRTDKPEAKRNRIRTAAAKDLKADDDGDPAKRTTRNLFPQTVWIGIDDGTRAPNFLEDRAAAYLPEQNLLQISRDFWAYDAMVKHCNKIAAGQLGAEPVVAATVRGWYEQALVETVIGVRALRHRKEWSDRDIEKALSPEALTAAVMQRYHVARCATEELQRKLRVAPTPGGQPARERPRQSPEASLAAGQAAPTAQHKQLSRDKLPPRHCGLHGMEKVSHGGTLPA